MFNRQVEEIIQECSATAWKQPIIKLKGVFLFAKLNDGEKDIEIQPGFKPGSSEFRLDALTNWATGLYQGYPTGKFYCPI